MYRNVSIGDITFTTNGTFVLNSIDIGSPEVDITSVPMNVGDFVIGNRMGGRDITLTGYVCTRDTQIPATSSIVFLKQELQKELLPLKEVTLLVDGCSIKCYAKSSIEWSVPFKENNKELCKFSVDLFAPNPFFQAPLKKVLTGDTFNMVSKKRGPYLFQVKYSVSSIDKADFRIKLDNHNPKNFNKIRVVINDTVYTEITPTTAVSNFEFNTTTDKFYINGNEVTPPSVGSFSFNGANVVRIFTELGDSNNTFDQMSVFEYSGTKPLVDTVEMVSNSQNEGIYTITYNVSNKDKAAVEFTLRFMVPLTIANVNIKVNGTSVANLELTQPPLSTMTVNLETGVISPDVFTNGVNSYIKPAFVEGNNVITLEWTNVETIRGGIETFHCEVTQLDYVGTEPLADTFTVNSQGPKQNLSYVVVYNASNSNKADFRGTFELNRSRNNTSITVNVNDVLYKKYSVANAGRVFVIDSHTGRATLDGTTLTASQSGTLNLKEGDNKVEVIADNWGFTDCTSIVYSGSVPLERYDWYCEGKYFGIDEDVLIVTQNMVSAKEMNIIVYNKGHNSRDYMSFGFTTSPASPSSPPLALNLKMNNNPWITVNRSGGDAPWGDVFIDMYTGDLITQYDDRPNIKEWNSEFFKLGRNVINISLDAGTLYSLMSNLEYSVSLLEV